MGSKKSREAALPGNLASGLLHSQLPALDGLRAVAAFTVVFYHFGVHGVSGGLGVLIFFVLSGFLITWLLLKENEKFGTVSLRDFYLRRALRIFPAFYCYWGLLIGMAVALNLRIVWGQAVASLLYFNNYYQAIHGDPNTGLSHTWSLAIEEQFYLLWPLAFLLLRKNYARMAKLLLGVIITVWVYRAVLHFVVHADQGYLYEAFEARADHLMMGCLLAVALRGRFAPGFWTKMCARPWLSAVTASLILASNFAEYRYGSDYRDTLGHLLNPLLVAILIAQLIAFRSTALWSWLNWGWVRYLGRISYSVYLYQQVVMHPASKVVARFGPIAELAAAVASVVLFASGSYYVIERPFLKLKDRFTPKAGINAAGKVAIVQE